MRIAVLGAGAWGTSFAISLSSHSNASSSHQVILWTRNAAHLAELDAQRFNKRYFPAFPLPESLRLTSSLFTAIETADLALVIVPVSGLRETLRELSPAEKLCQ